MAAPLPKNALTLSKPAECYHLSFGLPVATIRPFDTFGLLAWYEHVAAVCHAGGLAGCPTFDVVLSSNRFFDQVHPRPTTICRLNSYMKTKEDVMLLVRETEDEGWEVTISQGSSKLDYILKS